MSLCRCPAVINMRDYIYLSCTKVYLGARRKQCVCVFEQKQGYRNWFHNFEQMYCCRDHSLHIGPISV